MEFPNIKKEVLNIYEEKFLKLNKCTLGDMLQADFRYEELRPAYKKGGMDKFTFNKVCYGMLKKDNKGLYLESNEKFTFYKLVSNGLTDRERKTHYRKEKRPSIFRIKGGLDF